MPRESIQPSAALAHLLRQQRRSLGLTLRETSRQLEERGNLIPPSTLARIEQGRTDPGVRRAHQLLEFYEVPAELAAGLVEIDVVPEQVLAHESPAVLSRGLIEALSRGEFSGALGHYLALRRIGSRDRESTLLRQKAELAFGSAARDLGRLSLAKEVAEKLLCEPPDDSLIVETLSLAASVWRALGSPDAARAFERQTEARRAARARRHRNLKTFPPTPWKSRNSNRVETPSPRGKARST